MVGIANSLNISQQGTVYFNGLGSFSGIDSSTLGKVLTSNGTGVAPSFQTASGGITTINGDSGSITGSTVTIFSNNAAVNAGSTVKFVNSGTTSTFTVGVPANANTIMGYNAGNLTLSGIANTGFGQAVLNGLTSGIQNTGMGQNALVKVTSGTGNTGFGYFAGQNITTSNNNTAIGVGALSANCGNNNNAFGVLALQVCTGSSNLALGNNCLQALTTGTFNVALGETSGNAYGSNETGNILISSLGVVGDQLVTRIGNVQTKCFLAGQLITSSGQVVKVTTPGAYPYTTLTTDYVILVDSSVARTIVPLAAPVTGVVYVIKDSTGTSGANPITVTPSGKNIDGSASYVLSSNYGSINIVYNGTQWSIF